MSRMVPVCLVLAACGGAVDPPPESPPVPPPPPVRIIADHEFAAVTGISLGGGFGPSLEGNHMAASFPFRRFRCSKRFGDPACGSFEDAQLDYLWDDGSDGGLPVRVDRHTYPLLIDQRRADLSVRPPVGPQDNITGLRGTWWRIWRDTAQVEFASAPGILWEIAGRWGQDSVTISVAEDRIPRKVGSLAAGFPAPWTAADGAVYHHPAEMELAVYEGSVMRAGLGYTRQRYASRCGDGRGMRPVCSRIDPVVVVTVHGEGEVRLSGRRWQRGGEPAAVEQSGRPDGRGHAIFRHLVNDDGRGPSWFFAGGVSVRCDGGSSLDADVATLQRRGAFHAVEYSVAAFAWVFADCAAGTVTTMRQRYPAIPVVTP